MSTKAQDGLRAVTLLHRVMDITMEGTYGYIKRSLQEDGFSMLTARSTVNEFLVEMLDQKQSSGEWCLIGTDYYGRQLELPIDRVRWIDFKDTKEQADLRRFTNLYEMHQELLALGGEERAQAFYNVCGEFLEEREKLIASGITLYEPKRATEDEL